MLLHRFRNLNFYLSGGHEPGTIRRPPVASIVLEIQKISHISNLDGYVTGLGLRRDADLCYVNGQNSSL